MALKGATSVLKAQRDDELGSTQILQSYLQFLPNLSATGGYNYNQGKSYLTTAAPTLVNSKSYGASYSVSSSLNIFNGFSDIASWRSAHDRKHAADESLTRAKQQISLDISQSYLQVILDQKLVEIAQKNLKASQDRETLLEEQVKVGIRNKADLFRQQAQTSSDESFLTTAQDKRQTDYILLLRKLRIDPEEKYQLTEPPLENQVASLESKAGSANEQELTRQALDSRKDLDVTRLNAEASQHDVTSTRANYWPKLDFVASYLSSGREFDYQYVNGTNVAPLSSPSLNDQLRDQGGYVYGLVLTWNVFDRWSSSLTVERAKATAYKAQLDTEDFRRQVIGEVKQSLSDLKAATQQLDSSKRGLMAAQKAYDVTQGRYEVGTLTFVDLATAQTALVQAEAARAQALVGYELQKRALDFAVGTTPTE